MLLLVFAATSSTLPLVGLLILAIALAILLFYMSIRHVYKSKLVRFLESFSILNLLMLITCTLYTKDSGPPGTLALQLSMGLAFIQFLTIILISTKRICFVNKYYVVCTQRRDYRLISEDDDIFYERENEPVANINVTNHVRDTIDTY